MQKIIKQFILITYILMFGANTMECYGFQKRKDFINDLESCGNMRQACGRAEISRTTGYLWRNRFYDGGLGGLKSGRPVPNSFPRKISPEVENRVVMTSLRFPSKGVDWVCDYLKSRNTYVSVGKVQQILKRGGISRRQERFRRLLKDSGKDGIEALNQQTIESLEEISEHFKHRRFCKDRLGELVFLWREFGNVSHSRLKGQFDIFVDGCGSVAFILSDFSRYYLDLRDPIQHMFGLQRFLSEKHIFTDSITYSRSEFYSFYNISIKQILINTNWAGSPSLLEKQLKKYGITVRGFPESQFLNLPFVKDFRQLFRRDFLWSKLKEIHHEGNGEDTSMKVYKEIRNFISNYNQNHIISTYPNLGFSPYGFAGQCHNCDFHLPTVAEFIAKGRSKMNLKQ